MGALLVLVFLGLPSCTDTSTPNPLPQPPLVNTVSVDGVIGPEGGAVTHPAGARIVVPPGALVAPTRLTLAGIAAPPSEQVLGGTALGQGFAAGPEGQVFLKPVDVVVPFDPTRLPVGANVTGAQLRMAPHGSTEFESLRADVDLAHRTLNGRTLHFTDFVPAETASPVFITTPTVLSSGVVAVEYLQPLVATGGTPPYVWSLSRETALPEGLVLDASGLIRGTPSAVAAANLTATATDAAGRAVEAVFSLAIATATNPLPVLVDIEPTSAEQGSAAIALTLNGSGFVPASQALWDGAAIETTFTSTTRLLATIPPNVLALPGTHQVSVRMPAPGLGTSASLPFVVTPAIVNPVPTISSVSPTTVYVSSDDTQIVVAGTGFFTSTSAMIGSQSLPTTFVSPTSLLAVIPASFLSAPGTLQVAVYNPPPGGGTSPTTIAVTVGTLNPVPTLSVLSPSSVIAGGPDLALAVTGNDFVAGGQIFFGGTALATTVSNATGAQATVPASLISTAGPAQVVFVNPAPGGGTSNGLTFTIDPVIDAGADAEDADGADGADASSSDAPADSDAADASEAADSATCDLVKTYTVTLTENIDTSYCQYTSTGSCSLITEVKTSTSGVGTITFSGGGITVNAPDFGINNATCPYAGSSTTASCYRNLLEPYEWRWDTSKAIAPGCVPSYSTVAGGGAMQVDLLLPPADLVTFDRDCEESWPVIYLQTSSCPPPGPYGENCHVSRSLAGTVSLGCP